MRKLCLVLLLVVLPGVSFAQGDGPEPKTFNDPARDVFFFRAEVCGSANASCGTTAGAPTTQINGPPNFVKGFVSFRVPISQTYTIFYLAPDIEGALNPTSIVSQGPVALNAGDTANFSAQFSALGSGVYRFTAIVIGANGRATISQPYQFRYCNAACITD